MIRPLCLGADPGSSGGIAVVYSDGTAEAHPIPETDREVIELAKELAGRWDPEYDGVPRAVLEYVRSSPQMGVKSAFTFGRNYGTLRTSLLAAGFSLTEVTPAKWQAAMGCRSGGDKNVTKAKALELFPGVKVTHAIADALLLASYGAREVGR